MKHLIIGAILASMAVGAIPVKTFAKDLSSSGISASNPLGLINDDKNAWARLIQVVMHSGQEDNFHNGLAQAIGLQQPMPSKRFVVDISDHNGVIDDRTVQIVYTTSASKEDAEEQPVCIYFRRGHNTKHDGELRYFRITLGGQLEKVVTLKNKIDDNGKALREGRVRIEEDIEDPKIREAFKAERQYWLMNWLKMQSSTTSDAKKI